MIINYYYYYYYIINYQKNPKNQIREFIIIEKEIELVTIRLIAALESIKTLISIIDDVRLTVAMKTTQKRIPSRG